MAKNAPAAKVKFDELVAMSETHTIHLHCGGENGNPHDPKTYAYSSLLAELVKEARRTDPRRVARKRPPCPSSRVWRLRPDASVADVGDRPRL